jgi:histidine ammonia-lyase
MPQVHGAVRDTLHHLARVLAVEIDSVTDNPLIFPNDDDSGPLHGEILSGGNFHGQPVALACDFAKSALASLASMSERRIEQLVNPSLSSGLPAFLAPKSGLHSGFMIAQVAAAALVSEAKALCFPNAVDSIPSSANREDHVSMGPIAARRLFDVLDLAERVVGIELLCAAQAVDLRAPLRPGVGTSAAWDLVRSRVPALDGDRVLYSDLDTAADVVRSGAMVAAVQAQISSELL